MKLSTSNTILNINQSCICINLLPNVMIINVKHINNIINTVTIKRYYLYSDHNGSNPTYFTTAIFLLYSGKQNLIFLQGVTFFAFILHAVHSRIIVSNPNFIVITNYNFDIFFIKKMLFWWWWWCSLFL